VNSTFISTSAHATVGLAVDSGDIYWSNTFGHTITGREVGMGNVRTAGFVWIVAAVLGALATAVFRVDQVQWVVTLVASAIGLAVGVWLVRRPSATAILASTLAGVSWVALYATLAVVQSGEVAAWVTDAFLAGTGAVGALLAFRARTQP
jgi:hypothetical protein